MSQDARSYLVPATIGGVSLGVASNIPFLSLLNCACCALVIGGGMLAAVLYMNRRPATPQAPYDEGAILGLITGVIGAIIGTIMQALVMAVGFGLGGFDQVIEQLQGADLPPEVLQMIENFGATGLSLFSIAIGFVFKLVLYSIFAIVGSLIGVAMMQRKST